MTKRERGDIEQVFKLRKIFDKLSIVNEKGERNAKNDKETSETSSGHLQG